MKLWPSESRAGKTKKMLAAFIADALGEELKKARLDVEVRVSDVEDAYEVALTKVEVGRVFVNDAKLRANAAERMQQLLVETRALGAGTPRSLPRRQNANGSSV